MFCCDCQQFHQYQQQQKNKQTKTTTSHLKALNTKIPVVLLHLRNVYSTKHEALSYVAYLEIVIFNSSHTTELLHLSEGLYPAAKTLCSISTQCGFHRVHNNLTALFK